MGNFLDYVNNQSKSKSKKRGSFGNYVTEQKIGLDTLESDLSSASDLLSKVYGGWHSQDDMKSSYKTVSSMRDRLSAYKGYTNDNSNGQDLTKYNERMDNLINAYDTALNGWNDLSAEYAKYADAESYGVAKKSAERYNKYKGMDYAGVQKAIKENPEDAEFLSKYGLNVGYANKADAEKEISAIDYLIETTTGAEQKALKDYRNRMYEMYMSNPKAVFKGSEAFADGWQPGDILDAIGSTAVDAVVTAGKGIASSMEGVADLATYGASGLANLLGADTAAAYMKDLAKTNMTQNLFLPYESSSVNRDSVLGGFSDSVAQGVGQMGFNLLTAGMGQGAGLGKLGSELFSKGALFASSAGNSMSEAYDSGATDREALIYGLLSGAIETGTEMMAGGFGNGVTALGLSHGLGGADDIIAKKIGEKIPNFVLRNAAEFGIKATGEGLEEVVAGFCSALAKNLTYMSEEDYWKLVEDEDLLNQFFVGTMASMVTQSPSLMRSYKYGTDFVTDRNGFEEAYVSEEFEKRLAEAEKDGNKLSGIEKDKLYHQVEEDLKKRQEEAREQYKRKASGSVSNMATYDTTDSVDNATGDTIKLHGVRNDSGNTVLKTNLGDRTLDSVTLNRRDAELVSATEGMDDDTADLFVSMYSGGSVESYKASFDLVHAYGNAAYGVENSVARRGVLTEEQAIKVYEFGVSERTSVPQKEIDAITEKHFANGEALKEGTFDDSAIHYEKLNSRQKASVAFLKMLSKATGMNVVMFESAVDENGHREAKQGYYEPSTNSIHIDVYAGMDKDLFDDAIIPVMSHEVTHWMQFKAPEAYAKMSGIIMDTMSRELGVSPEQLVAMERNRLKKSGHDADDAYAQDEIIARACEDMLSGNRKASEIIEQMDEETAKTFSEKFKEVISKIRAWLKDLLKAYKSNSEEAKIIRKYDDSLAKLQKAWDEGFEQAIRANQAIKTNGSGETKYSFSSIANSFFGNEKMSTDDFLAGGYKKTEGYRTYVEQCVNNMRQTRDISESVARAEVEKSIAGIVDVAIAAKKAGYDIYDDAEKRSKKDSKDRLLFSSLEPNSDYFTSSDISTICDKRQNFAEIYDDIIRAEEEKGVPEGKRFFNNVDNYFYIHKVLADKGLTQPCRQCYVESMRKNLTPMANAFLKLIRETNPGNKANDQLFHQSGKSKGELKTNNATLRERVLEQLEAYGMSASKINLKTLTTEEGLAQLKIQAPLIYEAFNSFYGQSKPKMPKAATPFRFGELAAMLTDNHGKINARLVRKINHTGGFRLQSYSDFQIKNFVDVLQVIFEAGTLGLNGHAYTKVPAFLDATENTNLKRNISIFMYNDGGEWKLDRNDSFPYALDEIYDIVNNDKSGNTSIIAVSQNAEMSAWIMANNNVGYGIPFHKSGLKMGVVRDTIVNDNGRAVKGYSKTKDHTKQQTEVWAKTNGDNKALTKVKKGIDIYEFWDFENKANLSKNKLIEKNLKAYIDACDAAGYLPKFREYVMNNSKVLSDVLRFAKELGFASADATVDDISFKYKGYQIPYGYYKFLGDFGMFTPDGKAAPQKILSLKDYNFDEAVKFFEDGEVLRRNEILQQFSNGEEREKYRNSNLSTEELEKVIKSKRTEVVDEIVGGRKYSTRDVAKLDADYLKAVQSGDMETAQKMVDEAAKKAGYNSPKLYHGTGRYGFTAFDMSKLDDGFSIFATNDARVAETYSGETERRKISERVTRDIDTVSDDELLEYVKKYIDEDYHVASKDERIDLIERYVDLFNNAYSDILWYVDENEERISKEQMDLVEAIGNTVRNMAYTHDSDEIDRLYTDYNHKFFDLMWMNTEEYAFSSDLGSIIGDRIYRAYRMADEINSTDTLYVRDIAEGYLLPNEARGTLYRKLYSGIYSLYGKTEGFFEIDVDGSNWNNIDGSLIGKYGLATTRDVAKYANDNNYNGVVIKNVRDVGGATLYSGVSDVYIFFDNTSLKSADTVTYDDAGNVIPLSQRFNTANEDIRYSTRDSEGNGLTKEQIEHFAESKARDDEGSLLVLYHGTQEATFHSFNTDTIFLTTNPRVAKAYTSDDGYVPKFVDEGKGNIYRLYADIKNPLIVDAANHITGKYDVEVLYYMNTDKYSLTFTNGTETFTRTGYGREFIHSMFAEKDAETIVSKAESMEPKSLYSPVKFNRKGKNIDITEPNVYTDIVYNGKTMSADEIAEIAKKEGYDGVIINNVIDDLSFSKNGISATDVIVFSSNQLKRIDNENPTSDPDIRYSERQTESIYDAVGELKRIQRENDKLKADIERLRKKNRLERTVTGGRELNESQIAAVAGHVLKMAGSRYNKTDFVSELKGIYEYLQGENVEWDVFMSKATDAAQRIIAEARERKVKDDYAMTILSAIRNTRVSFNDTQKAEAEYAYGKNWNRSFFGRVTVANDGIPLESAWSEWASMYPDVFDSDISDADMVTALLDIYDSTRTASEVVETYDKSEAAREIAFEIYNQFWNVSPVRTLADKHDKEVKRLKFEHRQEMKELRERKNAEVFETQWHYSKLIHDVRKARDEKIAQLKKESREYTKQYREKVERRNQISQITKKSLKLNTWLKNNSKDEHIVEELKAPVAAVLRALDFSSERFLGTGVPTQKDISLKKAFAHLHDSLDEIYKRQGEENYTIDMPVDYVEFVKGIKDQVDGIVEKVGDNEYILRDMTLEQLQDVNKMLSVLTHIVTSANKALADANGKAISTMAQSTMLYADGLGDKSSKVGAISNFFNFDNGLPVYVFKMMGEGGYQIFRNMQNGWDKMAFHVKQIIDYSKESYDAKEVKEWGKEVHEFSFDDGSNVKMTTAQIMSLYCLQKRDQARMHLLKGGMRVADFKIGADTISNEAGALLLPHEIDRVVSVLTKRQKEVADSLQKFMNTVCSDWGNEVSMRRFGIKSFGEENYFPIQSDSSVLTGDDTPKTDRGSDVFRLLNMDFTKALNPHANNRIVVDDIFDVFATHTSDMAKYNALALPVLDMFRWYNYKESYRINPDNPEDTRMAAKSLKQSLKKAYGDGSTRYIMQFMKDLNGAHSGGMSNLEKVGRKLISNYKVAAVGANLRVAILQPTSYVRASAVIDAKYLTAALAHKPQIQKAKDTCGIALWKSLGFYDTNISKGVTSLIKHDENAFDWMRDKAMKLAEWGDAMTWGYLYNACEAEIKDTQPNLTGAAKDKAVADRLREVIYATQVVDSTMTRTQNMRDSSMMNQIMTSFMSEPSLSYNMLHDLYIQYNADKRQYGKGAAFKKNGKKIARVSASYLITMCCASVAGGLVDTLRDDDDEEEFGEALISNAAENALSDVLGMLPLVKDIVSIYKGFNVGRMDMQGIQSSYYAYRKLYKMVTEKDFDYKTVYSAAKSVAQTFSQLGGLPVSNLWREFTTIWNNTIGEVYESLKIK